MKPKFNMIVLAVLICFVATGTAFAWGGCGRADRPGRDHKGRMEEMAKELGLTPEQQTKLEAAKETHRAEMEGLHTALKEKREALKAELSKPGVTRQAVEPLVAEIKNIEARLTDMRIDGIFTVKGILTPEQLAKLEAGKDTKRGGHRMAYHRKG